MHKRIIRQYYLLSALFNAGGLQIICAIYVAFLLKNGMSLFQTNVVNASFFLTMFVCEIPTGAFADIFGRKNSFVIACCLMCASMAIYGSSHTIVGFILAEMLAAVGCTFKSGAFQAWLVDSLKHERYKGDIRPIFARESLIRQIGGCIGAITGSYLYGMNPAYPWFAGGIGMAVTTAVAWLVMEEHYFVRKSFSWKEGVAKMRSIAVKSIRYGMEDKAVRFVLIATGIQFLSVQALNMYWQPFFEGRGMNPRELGWIFSGIMAMMAAGAWFVSRWNGEGKEKRAILYTQIAAGSMMAVMAFVPGLYPALIFFLVHELPRGTWNPLMDSYLQKRIPSSERATISSFCSVAPEITGVIGLIASGAIAEKFGIGSSWAVSGTFLLIGTLWMARNGNGKD